MKFEKYIIDVIHEEVPNVYFVKLKAKNGLPVMDFKPGQFFHIKNLQHSNYVAYP